MLLSTCSLQKSFQATSWDMLQLWDELQLGKLSVKSSALKGISNYRGETPDLPASASEHVTSQGRGRESPSRAPESSVHLSGLCCYSEDQKRREVMPCHCPTYSSNSWAAPSCSIMAQKRFSSSSAGSRSSAQPDSKVSSCLQGSILPAPRPNSIPSNFSGGKRRGGEESQI